jgi:hypothetical protein
LKGNAIAAGHGHTKRVVIGGGYHIGQPKVNRIVYGSFYRQLFIGYYGENVSKVIG